MKKVGDLTGQKYHLFDYVGHPEADKIIVSMASSCDVIEETINKLNAEGGSLDLLKVRLYLPFSKEHFFKASAEISEKDRSSLDRTKTPGALGDYFISGCMYSNS